MSLIAPLAFAITMGLLGVISNTCYYLNIPTEKYIYIIYIIAFIVLPSLWKRKQLLRMNFQTVDLTKMEKILGLLILYMIFLYIHKAFAPWSDYDEVARYGYKTRLIGLGYSHQDKIELGWPAFAESMYSYFYYAYKTMILPKLVKIFGVLFCASLLGFIINLYTKRILFSLLGICCFLLTPEFSFKASSMKPDNVLMLFELCGFTCFIILGKFRSVLGKDSFLKFSFCALSFILIAFAVRTSAIYGLIIVFSVITYLYKGDLKYYLILISLCLPIGVIVNWGYIQNIIDFSNPFYPLGGAWNMMFENPSFKWPISDWQSRYNIFLGNAILEILYIPVYASLGFTTTLFGWADFIVHPYVKTASISWANPLFIFTIPSILFLIENKEGRWLYAFYISLFLFWFLGIQYTRIFFAETAILILIIMIIINYKYTFKTLEYFRKIVMISVISIVVVFPIYHSLHAFIRMPNNALKLPTKKNRYTSNQRYYKYASEILFQRYNPSQFPYSIEDIEKINLQLNEINKPEIASTIPIAHIFFQEGNFTNITYQESEMTIWDPGEIIDDADCFLGHIGENKSTFPNEIFRKSNGYGFWCK